MEINERVLNSIQELLDAFEHEGQTDVQCFACEEAKEVLQLVRNLKTPIVKGKCKVYDIESNTLHNLVEIDFENSIVVMENEEYGHTSNTLDKIRLIQI